MITAIRNKQVLRAAEKLYCDKTATVYLLCRFITGPFSLNAASRTKVGLHNASFLLDMLNTASWA